MLLEKNGKSGYFSSNRYGGVGDDDVYHFDLNDAKEEPNLVASLYTIGAILLKKPEPLPMLAKIKVDLKDAASKQLLKDGIVWAYNVETEELNEVPVKDGMMNFTAKMDAKFILKSFSNSYETNCATLNLAEKKDTVVNYTFELGKPGEMKLTFRNILYDYDKSNIRTDAVKDMDIIYQILSTNKNATVELGSHTDSRGTDEYNMSLSQNRAKSATQYLVSKGIDKKRISPKGFGKSKLLDDCSKQGCPQDKSSDCPCHQQNRRTEFQFKGLNTKTEVSPNEVIESVRKSFKEKKGKVKCD